MLNLWHAPELFANCERSSFRHFALPPQETWEPIPKNSPKVSLLRNRLPSFWSRLANIDREREGENSAMGTRPHNRLGCRWACLKLHASSPSLISFYSSTLWEISELLCFSASWSQSHKKLSAWHPGIRVLNTNAVHQIGETLCTFEKICTITHGEISSSFGRFFYNAPPNKLRHERGFFPLIVVHQSSIHCISKSDSSPACCCSACAWPCTRSRTRGAPPPRPPRRSCRTCASAAYTELEEPVTGRKSHLGIMRMWFEQSQQGSIFLQSSRVKKYSRKRDVR